MEGAPVNAGKLVLSPTRTYAPVIKKLLDEMRADIHGMVHCSGGAQTKVMHFVEGKHVVKDNLFPVPPLFDLIQRESGTDWKEMYKVFNMGHRMEIYVKPEVAQRVIAISESMGIPARIVGRVEDSGVQPTYHHIGKRHFRILINQYIRSMRKSAVLLPNSITVTCNLLDILVRTGNGAGGSDSDSTSHALPDTLRVGTLYSPTSYFIYREEQMGYDYDMVTRFGADKGIAIDLHVAPSLTSLVEMLDSGIIDLAAYEIPITAEYKPHVVAAGDENITTQVLVQPKSDNPITDVTQLAGREVYVEAGSEVPLPS